MDSVLHALLVGLRQRAAFLSGELQRIQASLPQRIRHYSEKLEKRIERSASLIEILLQEPDIKNPHLSNNYYYEYKRISEFLSLAERTAVVALVRFSSEDDFMSKIVEKACREISFPYKAPICSSASTDYYWTLPDMDIIFVPCSEPFHLLSLSDLYHELAHFLLLRDCSSWIVPGQTLVDDQYDSLIQEAIRKAWPQPSIDRLRAYRSFWKGGWYVEFVCDMVAAYCVGPAFGWANLILSSKSGDQLFDGAVSHPAHDARNTAIGLMLERIEHRQEATKIEEKWGELVSLTGLQKGQEYNLMYPPQLIEALADLVVDKCKSSGLNAMSNLPDSNSSSIRHLLNTAWDEFVADPDGFTHFEEQRLGELRTELGIRTLVRR